MQVNIMLRYAYVTEQRYDHNIKRALVKIADN